ncbi:Flp family type IVb pilin [Nocardioides sp.]|uniref:Flp family type IVb pilin n=1 Tax=Nocardioides sp. TaxID=35761 RepID=UPI003219B17A
MIEYLSILVNAQRAKMDERGASAVEYGLLIAGIAALIIAVVFLLGGQIKEAFDGTCDKIAASNASGGECADS